MDLDARLLVAKKTPLPKGKPRVDLRANSFPEPTPPRRTWVQSSAYWSWILIIEILIFAIFNPVIAIPGAGYFLYAATREFRRRG